jgi:hypothetical protein
VRRHDVSAVVLAAAHDRRRPEVGRTRVERRERVLDEQLAEASVVVEKQHVVAGRGAQRAIAVRAEPLPRAVDISDPVEP